MEKFSGKPVTYQNSKLTGGFWKERQDTGRAVTLEAIYDRFEETGRFRALNLTWKEGMPNKPHIFFDSDTAKWIEGAAYYVSLQRDEKVEAQIDDLIARMKKAQMPDGYMNSYFETVDPQNRFTHRGWHELYCCGHLIEAAIAYDQATGKKNLLELVERYVDHIDKVFRVDHSAAYDTPGHEEIELALFKLYRYTGQEKYKTLAEYFLNTRGTSPRDHNTDGWDDIYYQTDVPLRKLQTADGHAVRAMYLLSGMADMALEDKDEEMAAACERVFRNVTTWRMYLTGGIGSTHVGEAFSFDYDLPEYRAYNETCASIALALFCRRMWLINADGRYADCAEQALYNTVLSGVSLSGDEFFYENPMAVDPKAVSFNSGRCEGLQEHMPILQRVKVFACSCCPPNLLRTLGSITDYQYSTSGRTIFAQCYMQSDAEIPLEDEKICLSQKTEYPWDGKIEFDMKTGGRYTMALRIPGWCRQYNVSVNGEKIQSPVEKGFLYVDRTWTSGDKLVLDLEMKPVLVEANPMSKFTCGEVAVARGPVVYAAETVDNDNSRGSLRDIAFGPDSTFALQKEEICGVPVVCLAASGVRRQPYEELYREAYTQAEEPVQVHLIPYFTWANRGPCEMTTWFRRK